uniref:Protein SNOWY COTYLEDON 3 n=1 Tax=Leersia perrieri TaxID=77586 RepID=A0A0D9XIS8_9ORYZ
MAATAAAQEPRHPLAPAPNSAAGYSSSPRRGKPSPTSTSRHVSSSAASATAAAAAAVTTMRMRSLSVSFQGQSFVYETPRAAPPPRRAPPGPRRQPRHRNGEAENERPPPPSPSPANALARTLDCSLHRKESILAAVRLLRGDATATDEHSACSIIPTAQTRFWQETNSRLRRLPESRLLETSPSPSPSRLQLQLQVGKEEEEARAPPPANAPSIISFATAVRRGNRGEDKIEEAHRLRLLDNRHLQWRCLNAHADAAAIARSCAAEKALDSAWKDISALRDNVSLKRSKLQLQKQKLKIFGILKGQISYLEEWSDVERNHSSSMSEAIKALKASIIRLPIVCGAKADVQCVREAVNSAVVKMDTMASSLCSLLSKVEGMSSMVVELAKVVSQEQMLLDQSRDLFSAVAVMHVKQCSLQACILQGNQKLGQALL